LASSQNEIVFINFDQKKKSGGTAMNQDRLISTIETHTGGEPFRIVTSGLPRLKGDTIVAKRTWIKTHHDEIRKFLMYEPRGHADMYGGYLVDSVSDDADFGVIFLHNEGYSDHCGHGIIALASTAVKLGWVERTQPKTRVGIDAPCGFIEAFVKWDGEKVGNVRFVNVPSFMYIKDATVDTPSFGEVIGDIAFGGAFYFYMNSASLDIPIGLSQVETLRRLGNEVKIAANKKYKVVHPEIAEINHVYGTIIDNISPDGGASQSNVCIFADRQVDRSPTGSGTAGRAAQLFARGELQVGQVFTNESIVGSVFSAKVVKQVKYHGFDAVIPEVEGNANVIGYANWIVDPDDEIGKGFLVRE